MMIDILNKITVQQYCFKNSDKNVKESTDDAALRFSGFIKSTWQGAEGNARENAC